MDLDSVKEPKTIQLLFRKVSMADFKKLMSQDQDSLPFCLFKRGYEAAAAFGNFLLQKCSMQPTNTQPTSQLPTNGRHCDSTPSPSNQLDMPSLERKLDEELPQVMEQNKKLLEQNKKLMDQHNQLLDQNSQLMTTIGVMRDEIKDLQHTSQRVLECLTDLLKKSEEKSQVPIPLSKSKCECEEEIFSLKATLELKEKEIYELTTASNSNMKLLNKSGIGGRVNDDQDNEKGST